MIKVQIKNAGLIRRAFQQSDKTIIKELKDNIRKSALKVWKEARDRSASKRTPVITGRLINSIFIINKGINATIQPNVEYADAVHEGVKKSKSDKRKKGQPFMKWALERSQNDIEKLLGSSVNKIISNIRKKTK